MSAVNQLKALMWKNMKLRIRHKTLLLFEIAIPIIMTYSVSFLRKHTPTTVRPKQVFELWPVYDGKISQVIFDRKTVYYPDSDAAKKLMDARNKLITPNVVALDEYDHVANSSEQSIVVFENMDKSAKNVPKKLRYRFIVRNDNYDSQEVYGGIFGYYEQALLETQVFVAETFINYWRVKSNKAKEPLVVHASMFPANARVHDPFEQSISFVEMVLLFAFIVSVMSTAKTIVLEREMKLKETMKLMGVLSSVYYLSQFLIAFLMTSVVTCIITFICYIKQPDRGVLHYTSPLLLVFTLEVFVINATSFAMFFSCFIKKASNATILCMIAYYGLFEVGNVTTKNISSYTFRYLKGIPFFTIGYMTAIRSILALEAEGTGSTFSNINGNPSPHYNFTLLDGIFIMWGNTLFNFLAVWYMDNIYPGEFGIPQPFYFCLMPNFWFPKHVPVTDLNELKEQNPLYFEAEPHGLVVGIQIRDLVKYFGKQRVLNKVNFNIYEGQITVLLGHNGAGKTTTMSIITGFLPPSSGTAIVNGYDITKNIKDARSSLGLCPQHDILYDDLSCEEHLRFYCMLKGMKTTGVDDLLKKVGLFESKNVFARHLSGGQKRKLSIATAIVGDSKIIVLDEPSSGLDPEARHELWSFLKGVKAGRTILLTTHYMDEADVLGDRIAIMATGVVKCCGTPMFLKRIYGSGYTLSLVKKGSCKVNKLTDAIQAKIPEAQFKGVTPTEVTYLLPVSKRQSFPNLLRYLESEMSKFGISNFGLTATTMEEVFIKVGLEREISVEKMDSDKTSPNIATTISASSTVDPTPTEGQSSVVSASDTNQNNIDTKQSGLFLSFSSGYKNNKGATRICQQMWAILVKRIILTKRSWLTTLMHLGVIPLFLLLGLYGEKASISPPMWLSLDGFESIVIPVGADAKYGKMASSPSVSYSKQFTGTQRVVDIKNATPSSYYKRILKLSEEMGTGRYRKRVLIGALFLSESYISFFQDGLVHGQGISMQYMLNALVQYDVGLEYSLESGSLHQSLRGATRLAILTMLALSFAMALAPALFIYTLILERQCGAKHMQLLCGVNFIVYWVPTFIWDLILYLFVVAFLMLTYLYNPTTYINDGRWKVTLTIIIVFGLAMLPYAYVMQMFFKTPSTGVALVVMFNIVFGVVMSLVLTLVLQTKVKSSVPRHLDDVLLTVSPNYSLSRIVICFTILSAVLPKNAPFHEFLKKKKIFFEIDLGKAFYSMVAMIIWYWCLIVVLEMKPLKILWYLFGARDKGSQNKNEEESDVAKERQRIERTKLHNLFKTDSVILRNVCKSYPKVIAVDNICIGMPEHECFGLLGQSGAGKTSVFKVITGQSMVSGGNVYLRQRNIRTELKKVQSNMGYCPQENALHDMLTFRETMYLYGRLRGVPEKNLAMVVSYLAEIVDVKEHENKPTKVLSGGNKRKVSTAMSLIGNPDFLLLDEPTSGMDPATRRSLWNVLQRTRSLGKTILLTSHSMEECETLCTRIAIMNNGSLKCLGSSQHLKSKYALGYSIVVHLKLEKQTKTPDLNALTAHLKKELGQAEIFEKQIGYVHYVVPKTQIKVSSLFEIMEKTQSDFNLKDYTIHQTTLEQVFLQLSKVVDESQKPKHSYLYRMLSLFD